MKTQIKKLAFAMSLTLGVASFGVYAAPETIAFGVDASYAPFESKSPSGEMIGFDIDLANAMCAELKAKCVYVENDFDGLIPALQAKKFDAILSSLSVTESRAQVIDFSDIMYLAPVRMIAAKGSTLQPTAESLKGKRVGVEQGTIQETYANTKWKPFGVEVVPYQNQDLVLADMESGRLDASLQDEVQASEGFLKTPRGAGFDFAGPVVEDKKLLGEGTAIGLRKGEAELKAELNKALAAIHANGTYDKLMKKYFDFSISPK